MNRQDLLIAKALAQAKARRVIEEHRLKMEPQDATNQISNIPATEGIGDAQNEQPAPSAAPPLDG